GPRGFQQGRCARRHRNAPGAAAHYSLHDEPGRHGTGSTAREVRHDTGGTAMADKWEARREALGAFIREQRQQARLSLRQLAEMTSLSNPYLSQVERGLHQPSIRALK